MTQLIHRALNQELHNSGLQNHHTLCERMETDVGLLSWQNRRRRRKVVPSLLSVAALVGIGAVAYAGSGFFPGTCLIKGNISAKGERIYHVPGGKYYGPTRINTAKGERWFCTDAEARTAGWRRSRR